MPDELRSTEETQWPSAGEEQLQDTPIVESAGVEFARSDQESSPPPDSDSPPPEDQDTGYKMYQAQDVTKED